MTEQTGTQTVNGVDVSKLKETIQAVKQTPTLADFRFRIVNKWQGGGLNQTTVKASYGAGQDFPDRDGKFTMQADEPPILLSGDKAANPVEHLLHALASCVTTTMVYHAAARGIPL
ncbi:MAG TPA: OsmC family peroxiredoxin, partial [Candidatus Binatia bacterium]|nr:OsmC family peroxiredoxin [Candidatus Binatia bacterium]